MLLDAGQEALTKIRAKDCPFCHDWEEALRLRTNPGGKQTLPGELTQDIFVSTTRFKRHVAVHQEQLAIFALPRTTEENGARESVSDGHSHSHVLSVSEDDEAIERVKSSHLDISSLQLEPDTAETRRLLTGRWLEDPAARALPPEEVSWEDIRKRLENVRIKSEEKHETLRKVEEKRAQTHAEGMSAAKETHILLEAALKLVKIKAKREATKTAQEQAVEEVDPQETVEGDTRVKSETELKAAKERGKRETEGQAEVDSRRQLEADLKPTYEGKKKEAEAHAQAEEIPQIRPRTVFDDEDKVKQDRNKEAHRQRLDKERLAKRFEPSQQATVNPGGQRHLVLYDDGTYRWEEPKEDEVDNQRRERRTVVIPQPQRANLSPARASSSKRPDEVPTDVDVALDEALRRLDDEETQRERRPRRLSQNELTEAADRERLVKRFDRRPGEDDYYRLRDQGSPGRPARSQDKSQGQTSASGEATDQHTPRLFNLPGQLSGDDADESDRPQGSISRKKKRRPAVIYNNGKRVDTTRSDRSHHDPVVIVDGPPLTTHGFDKIRPVPPPPTVISSNPAMPRKWPDGDDKDRPSHSRHAESDDETSRRLELSESREEERQKRRLRREQIQTRIAEANAAIASRPAVPQQLSNRYSQTGTLGDLNEAIRVARDAVIATPQDHPNAKQRRKGVAEKPEGERKEMERSEVETNELRELKTLVEKELQAQGEQGQKYN